MWIVTIFAAYHILDTKLKKDIEDYYKPFNHDYEDSSSGLGLGLYISNNIIKIHGFKLEYEYLNGYNYFVVKLK